MEAVTDPTLQGLPPAGPAPWCMALLLGAGLGSLLTGLGAGALAAAAGAAIMALPLVMLVFVFSFPVWLTGLYLLGFPVWKGLCRIGLDDRGSAIGLGAVLAPAPVFAFIVMTASPFGGSEWNAVGAPLAFAAMGALVGRCVWNLVYGERG